VLDKNIAYEKYISDLRGLEVYPTFHMASCRLQLCVLFKWQSIKIATPKGKRQGEERKTACRKCIRSKDFQHLFLAKTDNC